MFRVLAILAAAATLAAAAAPTQARPFERRTTLALIEHDIQREDSRVFHNRERGNAIEAKLTVNAVRYALGLQRPAHHEFLLVIESRDGKRCPGVQTIIVGTRSGRIYHGVCMANLSLEFAANRAYYEAELDRVLAIFHPLLAPYASARREES